MKHHQFETWILMDADLSHDQQQLLHGHLNACSQCQALYQATHQIAHLFKTAPQPVPAAGFSSRWLDRVERQDKQKTHRIVLVSLGVISLATALLLSVVGFQLRATAEYFPQMMLEFVTLIANWIIFLNRMGDIVAPLLRVGFKLLSPVWLYAGAFALSGITAAWTIAFYRSRSLQEELSQ